jgi:dTDP-4-dehydrorhamnose 3,5-epimerase
MRLEALTIPGAYRVIPKIQRDSRGHFTRLFDHQVFSGLGLCTVWCQEATSMNLHRGTVRGIHWQCAPEGEAKLVRCARGAIFDVLVDLRPESPMCGQWESVTLLAETQESLYIPEGCAHGFQALEDLSEVHYLISRPFFPDLQAGVRWDDPALSIPWPLRDVAKISARDAALPTIELALRRNP